MVFHNTVVISITFKDKVKHTSQTNNASELKTSITSERLLMVEYSIETETLSTFLRGRQD